MKYFKFETIEYLVYLQIFYAVTVIYSLYYFKEYGYEVSTADYLMTSSSPWIYGIIIAPAVIMFMFNMNKDDLLIQYVLKYKSSRIIFIKQCAGMIVINLITVAYHIGSLMLWSYLLHNDLINWDLLQSQYYLSVKKISCIAYEDFLWRYALGMIVSLCVITMIGLIFEWMSNRMLGIAVVLLIAVIDGKLSKVKLIFSGILPGYKNIENTGAIMPGYIMGTAVFLILFVFGMYVARRREYINVT